MDLLSELKSINTESKVNLSNLTISELKDVITVAERLVRNKEYTNREERKTKALNELKVGDIIMVDSDKFKGEIWEVLKLNIKKAKCKRENGEIWNIAYSSILMS